MYPPISTHVKHPQDKQNCLKLHQHYVFNTVAATTTNPMIMVPSAKYVLNKHPIAIKTTFHYAIR